MTLLNESIKRYTAVTSQSPWSQQPVWYSECHFLVFPPKLRLLCDTSLL